MQNYIDIANKNGVSLIDSGICQLCGAPTTRGVHECVELFHAGFDKLDYRKKACHIYRFISVDAHTLQHPELHGRWNNHFHLTRLHLTFYYGIQWNYQLSPKLSNHLNQYKVSNSLEYLSPPSVLERGSITVKSVKDSATSEDNCKQMIRIWGLNVYGAWKEHHVLVDNIALSFLEIYRRSINLNQTN